MYLEGMLKVDQPTLKEATGMEGALCLTQVTQLSLSLNILSLLCMKGSGQ